MAFQKKQRVVVTEDYELDMPCNAAEVESVLKAILEELRPRARAASTTTKSMMENVTVRVDTAGNLLFTVRMVEDPHALDKPVRGLVPPDRDGNRIAPPEPPPFEGLATERTGPLPELSVENAELLMKQPSGTYYFRCPPNLIQDEISMLRMRARSAAEKHERATGQKVLIETKLDRSHDSLAVTTVHGETPNPPSPSPSST